MLKIFNGKLLSGVFWLTVFFSIPLHAASLNDTGQDTCYDGTAMVACSEANSGDASPYPRQDGRIGRDAAATFAGQLTKEGGGDNGFDFTRVCMSGELAGQGTCSTNPTQGTNPDEWACTKDNVTNLIWSLDSATYNWADATSTYPAAMNATGRCGFSTGWRLPTTHELLSIVHNGLTYPSIDIAYFPGTYSGSYWNSGYYRSADTWAINQAYAWGVDFNDGHSDAFNKSSPTYARLVHDGQPLPAQAAFTVNGDSTVTDTVTGLIWDQCSWGQSDPTCATGIASLHNWQQALGVAISANASNYKNHNDWRLPNKNELESLVNYSRFIPATDSAFFPNTVSDNYWSSTYHVFNPTYAWSVDFLDGFSGANVYNSNYVRLVRGGQSFDSHTYTVTPVAGANGSISPPTPQQVHGGTTTDFTVTPDAHYHISSVTGCGGTFIASPYTTGMIAADCAVTANFAIDTHDLSVAIIGEGQVTSSPAGISCSSGTGNCSASYEYGTSVILTAAASPGYAFTGWSGNCSGTATTCNVPMTAAKNATATFALVFTVTPVANAHGSISPSTPQQVISGSTTAFTVTPDANYHIASVTGCGGTLAGNTYTTGTISADCTVTVSFAIDTHDLTVTMDGAGAGTVTSSPAGISCKSGIIGNCTANYDYDTQVTLTAVADTGYTFAGWSGDCSVTAMTCVAPMTAAKNVTATFINVDLIITAVSTATTSIPAAGSFTMSDTEKNQGLTAMSAGSNTIYYYLSLDANITTADIKIGQRTASGALAAGASNSGSATVLVPGNLAPGTYYIGATADGANDQIEGHENNNVLAGNTITVTANVDHTPLLWYRASDGTTGAWLMDGIDRVSLATLISSPDWVVVGTGDLDKDGFSDILWHNSVTGQHLAWLMNGITRTSHASLLISNDWAIVGTGDLNADGMSDILWHNSVTGQHLAWLMNGVTRTSYASLLISNDWAIVGTGDLNGDGMSDILWHNPVTGENSAWLMNGTTKTSYASLLTSNEWTIAGTGDLDGDGKSDILWHNSVTGENTAWLMNGTSRTSSASLLTSNEWAIVGTGDINRDGKSDILWHNSVTGQDVIWLMNGTSRTSYALLFTGLDWIPIGIQ